jgi:hypothetical protein
VQSIAPGVTVLRQPGNPSNPLQPVSVVRGTNSAVPVLVDMSGIDPVPVMYQVLSYNNGGTGMLPLASGTVPTSGALLVGLGALSASGDYVVRFFYKVGGVAKTVDSNPFAVNVQGIDTAAGSYEVLLKDASGGILGDGAVYRGMVTLVVSKTGSVSGRVLYNEATPYAQAARVYTPVVRAFSSTFSAVDGNPLKLGCNPKLGSGAQLNRQELQLELNFSVSPPELNVVLRDNVSYSGTASVQVCTSVGNHANRGLTSLKSTLDAWAVPGLKSPEGRYVLCADGGLVAPDPGSDNHAYALIQVTSSGRVLWASRTTGSAGSGSATLVPGQAGKLAASLYEGECVSTSKLLNSRSLLGSLTLSANAGGVWAAAFGTDGNTGSMERQTSWVDKSASTVKWSSADLLAFTAVTPNVWAATTKDGLMSYLTGQASPLPALAPTLYLSATDPVGGYTYSWSVNVSATGSVRVAAYPAGTPQPILSLRLDRTRGEWTGSFTTPAVKGLRCSLFGTACTADPLRAQGWVEAYALPVVKTADWSLSATAPGN